MPLLPRHRPWRDIALATGAVLFSGWFLMKFHMDTANDSETQSYVSGLLADVAHATLGTDATGQYAALAPYVMWPFAASLQLVTGAYLIRGLVFALLALGIALCGLTYTWCRALGLGRYTTLLGLVLLTTSAAFALEIRGWEIDKLLEPVLFLIAAISAVQRRYALFVVAAALAALNAETGIVASLVILLAPRERRAAWAFGIALIVSAGEVGYLMRLAPDTHIPLWIDTSPHQLVNITGGLCLLPVLSLTGGRAIPVGMRWLLYAVVPAWVLFVLATHRLDQGAAFLAPLAVVWLPTTLLALEQLVRTAPMQAFAPEPAVRAAR